uniref:Fe2OG dioxygenase domain-containing protein n=1 Tax=Kalanchoe fedtschenkoi TaxID=63787 RepID=A0A7N0T610_KALFE
MSTKTLQTWPEPVISVQTLSESGVNTIPNRYIKPMHDRPDALADDTLTAIPVVNLSHIFSDDSSVRGDTMRMIDKACREWGFFQVVDHGVSHELMGRMLGSWREFFKLPVEVKQVHANSPATYEGYGSRVGVEKEAVLDWCDYFYLHFYPRSVRDPSKWPSLPASCREVLAEYGEALADLSGRLMTIFSSNLGLTQGYLLEAFGERSACLRANFYPKCPQPNLTLGLSPHSDPGGLTLLLADPTVAGLQIRKGNNWVTVRPLPNAFIVNLGDQIQLLSNGIYRSVEHRTTVHSEHERISIAFFYNPEGDALVQPANELVTDQRPARYPAMTFNEYRSFIRCKGLRGKSQVESLKLPNQLRSTSLT